MSGRQGLGGGGQGSRRGRRVSIGRSHSRSRSRSLSRRPGPGRGLAPGPSLPPEVEQAVANFKAAAGDGPIWTSTSQILSEQNQSVLETTHAKETNDGVDEVKPFRSTLANDTVDTGTADHKVGPAAAASPPPPPTETNDGVDEVKPFRSTLGNDTVDKDSLRFEPQTEHKQNKDQRPFRDNEQDCIDFPRPYISIKPSEQKDNDEHSHERHHHHDLGLTSNPESTKSTDRAPTSTTNEATDQDTTKQLQLNVREAGKAVLKSGRTPSRETSRRSRSLPPRPRSLPPRPPSTSTNDANEEREVAEKEHDHDIAPGLSDAAAPATLTSSRMENNDLDPDAMKTLWDEIAKLPSEFVPDPTKNDFLLKFVTAAVYFSFKKSVEVELGEQLPSLSHLLLHYLHTRVSSYIFHFIGMGSKGAVRATFVYDVREPTYPFAVQKKVPGNGTNEAWDKPIKKLYAMSAVSRNELEQIIRESFESHFDRKKWKLNIEQSPSEQQRSPNKDLIRLFRLSSSFMCKTENNELILLRVSRELEGGGRFSETIFRNDLPFRNLSPEQFHEEQLHLRKKKFRDSPAIRQARREVFESNYLPASMRSEPGAKVVLLSDCKTKLHHTQAHEHIIDMLKCFVRVQGSEASIHCHEKSTSICLEALADVGFGDTPFSVRLDLHDFSDFAGMLACDFFEGVDAIIVLVNTDHDDMKDLTEDLHVINRMIEEGVTNYESVDIRICYITGSGWHPTYLSTKERDFQLLINHKTLPHKVCLVPRTLAGWEFALSTKSNHIWFGTITNEDYSAVLVALKLIVAEKINCDHERCFFLTPPNFVENDFGNLMVKDKDAVSEKPHTAMGYVVDIKTLESRKHSLECSKSHTIEDQSEEPFAQHSACNDHVKNDDDGAGEERDISPVPSADDLGAETEAKDRDIQKQLMSFRKRNDELQLLVDFLRAENDSLRTENDSLRTENNELKQTAVIASNGSSLPCADVQKDDNTESERPFVGEIVESPPPSSSLGIVGESIPSSSSPPPPSSSVSKSFSVSDHGNNGEEEDEVVDDNGDGNHALFNSEDPQRRRAREEAGRGERRHRGHTTTTTTTKTTMSSSSPLSPSSSSGSSLKGLRCLSSGSSLDLSSSSRHPGHISATSSEGIMQQSHGSLAYSQSTSSTDKDISRNNQRMQTTHFPPTDFPRLNPPQSPPNKPLPPISFVEPTSPESTISTMTSPGIAPCRRPSSQMPDQSLSCIGEDNEDDDPVDFPVNDVTDSEATPSLSSDDKVGDTGQPPSTVLPSISNVTSPRIDPRSEEPNQNLVESLQACVSVTQVGSLDTNNGFGLDTNNGFGRNNQISDSANVGFNRKPNFTSKNKAGSVSVVLGQFDNASIDQEDDQEGSDQNNIILSSSEDEKKGEHRNIETIEGRLRDASAQSDSISITSNDINDGNNDGLDDDHDDSVRIDGNDDFSSSKENEDEDDHQGDGQLHDLSFQSSPSSGSSSRSSQSISHSNRGHIQSTDYGSEDEGDGRSTDHAEELEVPTTTTRDSPESTISTLTFEGPPRRRDQQLLSDIDEVCEDVFPVDDSSDSEATITVHSNDIVASPDPPTDQGEEMEVPKTGVDTDNTVSEDEMEAPSIVLQSTRLISPSKGTNRVNDGARDLQNTTTRLQTTTTHLSTRGNDGVNETSQSSLSLSSPSSSSSSRLRRITSSARTLFSPLRNTRSLGNDNQDGRKHIVIDGVRVSALSLCCQVLVDGDLRSLQGKTTKETLDLKKRGWGAQIVDSIESYNNRSKNNDAIDISDLIMLVDDGSYAFKALVMVPDNDEEYKIVQNDFNILKNTALKGKTFKATLNAKIRDLKSELKELKNEILSDGAVLPPALAETQVSGTRNACLVLSDQYTTIQRNDEREIFANKASNLIEKWWGQNGDTNAKLIKIEFMKKYFRKKEDALVSLLYEQRENWWEWTPSAEKNKTKKKGKTKKEESLSAWMERSTHCFT